MLRSWSVSATSNAGSVTLVVAAAVDVSAMLATAAASPAAATAAFPTAVAAAQWCCGRHCRAGHSKRGVDLKDQAAFKGLRTWAECDSKPYIGSAKSYVGRLRYR